MDTQKVIAEIAQEVKQIMGEEGKSHYCDEYETKIDNIDQLKKILRVLNFQSRVVVDKSRKTYLYQDYDCY